jgi:hypothetical protein
MDISTERYFMIFEVSELANINFEEVLETSIETIRKSIDRQKTFVKWDGNTPPSVEALVTKEGPYTYDQMLIILDGPEWTAPMPFFN